MIQTSGAFSLRLAEAFSQSQAELEEREQESQDLQGSYLAQQKITRRGSVITQRRLWVLVCAQSHASNSRIQTLCTDWSTSFMLYKFMFN